VRPVPTLAGPVDGTKMWVTPDDETGRYAIIFRESPAALFLGIFRINVNLWNPAAYSGLMDVVNELDLSGRRRVIGLSGTRATAGRGGRDSRARNRGVRRSLVACSRRLRSASPWTTFLVNGPGIL
jgi:hypothetical protein